MALTYFQSDPFEYPGGGIAVDVPVKVLFPSSTSLAPIYHNAVGSRKPNPTRTDAEGRVEFYAEVGSYVLLANGVETPIEVEGAIGDVDAAATALIVSRGTPGGAGVGQGRVYNDTGRTLVPTAVRVTAVNVAGGGLLVDVNKNGNSIYGTQQNRPALPAGAGTGTVKNDGFDLGTTLEDGSYVTVDVDQGTFDHLVVQIFVR